LPLIKKNGLNQKPQTKHQSDLYGGIHIIFRKQD